MTITIREKIILARRESKLTQAQLADKIDVDMQTYSRWERGVIKKIPTDALEKIAEATGKPLSFFLPEEAQIPSGIDPKILEALQDPIAVQALLITFKNTQDIKNTIKSLLDCLPNLTPEKRQAILALCK